MNGNNWWQALAAKLVENAPAIIVLLIVAWNQQQQINMLLERCVLLQNPFS